MGTELTRTALHAMAERLHLDPDEMQSTLMKTVMPSGGKDVSPEQFTAFVATANAYGLDPLRRQIYAFPAKGGGIQPVVSVDGWLTIINSRPDLDGFELDENFEDGKLVSVTCTIHRKSTNHPVVITEYLSENKRSTEQWKDRPIRMLRHRALCQAARYAFGLSGIMEHDEAARDVERDITPSEPVSALVAPKLDKTPEPAEAEEPVERDNSAVVKSFLGRIKHAADAKALKLIGRELNAESEEVKDMLRGPFTDRMSDLTQAA